MEKVRGKNQTYLLSKLLAWATSLEFTISGKLLYFQNFDLKCTKNDLFEQMMISSSRAIYKSILNVIQNV